MKINRIWLFLTGLALVGDQLLGLFFDTTITSAGVMTTISTQSDSTIDLIPIIVGSWLIIVFGLLKLKVN